MIKHRWTVTLLLAAGAWRAAGQNPITMVDLSKQGKLGTGTILPVQCTVGQIFFKTDAAAGSNLFVCATAGWAVVGMPGLSGDASGTPQSVTVKGIQGRGVSGAAPADQNVLRWNAASSQWEPGMASSTGAAAPPATCAAGSLYLRNDTANNIQQLYVCANANTWTMASARSGLAASRPVNCVAGQTWMSTDTGVMTFCSVTGTPGTWSATLAGPQGPAGQQGPPGTAGSAGPAGAAGPTGLQGPAGATGSQGPAGVAGPTGLQGPAGATGSQGPAGVAGPTGLQGPAGATGSQGPAGVAGATGLQGPAGATGSQGPAGANGNTIWSSTGAPSSGTGANGDFYLNTATNCLYGPKAAGAWPGSCVSLVGPQGPAGATGPQGPQGTQGLTGSAGPAGATGATGSQGSQGSQGPAGPIAGSNGQFTFNNSGSASGGNLSQNTDGSLTANKGFNQPFCAVTLSSNPTFDASQCNAFTLTLGGTPVTGSTLANARAGQELIFIIVQDGTGGRSFVWPGNVQHACTVSGSPGVSTLVTTIFDGANANATTCTSGDTPTLIGGPTRSAPGTPASGLACWFDSPDNTFKCKDPSGNVYVTPLAGAATAHQFLTSIDSHGAQQKAQPADADLSLTDITTNNVTTTAHGFAPKLPNDSTKYLDGTGSFSTPAGGGGGATAWPANLTYFPGAVGGVPGGYVSVLPVGLTTYCTDYYDPYSVTVNTMGVYAGPTTGPKYQTVVVFDTSGNKLIDANVSEASGNNWNKITLATPVTLSPGVHSWCTAWEASGSGWNLLSSLGNILNPGYAGAKQHNYSCSIGQSGSGATFSIPANGNCANSGTKTSQSMSTVGGVLVWVNP